MSESFDHDVAAAAGDCVADVPAGQLEREATEAGITADDPGEPIPDDAEVIG